MNSNITSFEVCKLEISVGVEKRARDALGGGTKSLPRGLPGCSPLTGRTGEKWLRASPHSSGFKITASTWAT